MKISIFASIWAQNLWDELILKNEIKLLEDKYWKDTKFIVFTYDKKNPFFTASNIVYREYFPIWIREWKNILKNIINFFSFIFNVIWSDLIVIWWGWIIYDNEVQSTKNPLDSWLFRVRVFRFFLKKIYFFRVWINITNESSLKRVKKIFKKASIIEVRDNYSYELLKSLWIKSSIEKDPVFYDAWELTIKKSIIWTVSSYHFDKTLFRDFDLVWKKIWLALRAWYFVEKSNVSVRMEEWRIREIINYLVLEWASVVLLPHSFHENDDLANDFLFMSNFIWEEGVSIKENMMEVYEAYTKKEIDICVSMRLHSIILSHVYEIPFIGVSYSTKTDEVLNELKK